MNSVGSTDAPTANTVANTAAARVENAVTRHATDFACASSPAPSAAPTRDCAAMASESSTSARKLHSCSTTWWAATAAAPKRAATAAAETKHVWKAMCAHHQIPAHHHLRAQHREIDPQRDPFDQQRPAEQQGGQPLPDQVGERRSHQFEPRQPQPSVHQQRAQYGGQRETRDDVPKRPSRVLDSAHPAVARQRDQDRGRAQHCDPQPRKCRGGDLHRHRRSRRAAAPPSLPPLRR